MLTLEEISEAYEILKPIVRHTPLEKSKTFSQLTKENVYLKLENLQTTGSFKIRGAYNKIYHLTEKEKKRGVVCASAGNHAQGVAYASALLHVKSTVFMPIYTPPTKILATKSYGANVVLEGKTYDDAYEVAKEYATKNNKVLIPAFNDEYVIAGQGTIGIEVAEDLQKIDAMVIPVGGGGLISGIAVALKSLRDNVKIIGVEAEGAQSMKQSLAKNKINHLKRMDTIADGIAVKTPGDITFELAKKYVDKVVTVTDEEIADALYLLLQRAKLVVEPAGATSLAAILSKKVSFPGKNIVALISGGNINLSLLTQIIEQGMMKNKLLVKISIIVNDKPKFLRDILTVLANLGANVQSISHDRGTTSVPVGYVKISITLQTLGEEQIKTIKKAFDQKKLKYQILH
ncbi:MAG: threonine ammonia-lyase [Candidatus Thermoplasmatota archaeon]